MFYMDRKKFIKNVCASGACLCGFGAMGLKLNAQGTGSFSDENEPVQKQWIKLLLKNAGNNCTADEQRKLIKSTSIAHFSMLGMDEVLKEFRGKLDHFVKFLQTSWGWKVTVDTANQTIIADEGKNYCVCPLLDKDQPGCGAICYCSEGFAEQMFSFVLEKEVQATVLSSVRRGGRSCIYQIKY